MGITTSEILPVSLQGQENLISSFQGYTASDKEKQEASTRRLYWITDRYKHNTWQMLMEW